VARTTLYDWPEFKKAKRLVKESGRKELSKGYKDSEGNLEAIG
jgi:hypothetical protein